MLDSTTLHNIINNFTFWDQVDMDQPPGLEFGLKNITLVLKNLVGF